MRRLTINQILEFYDVPQIFIANDALNISYLCLLYDYDSNNGYLYVGAQISPKRLKDFMEGHVDLRTIFIKPEIENSYYCITVKQAAISAEPIEDGIVPEFMLPDEGYFYSTEKNEDQDLISETLSCNHPIMRLGFEDMNNSHDIDATCLSQAINAYQSMVTNCHKKLRGKEYAEEATLRVTSFQPASFDVHFYVNTPLDIFGSSAIDETFKEINLLLTIPNDESLKEKIRYLKGHTINSYKNLVDILLKNRLSIKYKWVSSIANNEVIKGHVNLQRLERINTVLNENQDLTSEQKEFIGVFLASSVENGKWVMKVENNEKNINGESINLDILSGITIEQKSYKINCQEVQEQNTASLKITKKLILEKIKEA